MPGLKRVQTALKKCNILKKWVNQMREEGLMDEKQIELCTENCAPLHSFLCILIKGVKLKIENSFGKGCFLDVE